MTEIIITRNDPMADLIPSHVMAQFGTLGKTGGFTPRLSLAPQSSCPGFELYNFTTEMTEYFTAAEGFAAVQRFHAATAEA